MQHYYHAGKGNWRVHTGDVQKSKKIVLKQPIIPVIQHKKKQGFAVSRLKPLVKPSSRTKKTAPVIKHAPITKVMKKPVAKVYKAFMVTGDTYPNRHGLAALGKWNRDYEAYMISPKNAKQLMQFVKGKKLNVKALKTDEDVFKRLTEADKLNIRTEKAERKVDRLTNTAQNREKEAARRYRTADNLVKDIPLGQPILVGHHSEKAHRRVIDKCHNNMFKGVEAQREGEEARYKASSLARQISYVENPTQLKGRVAKLEKELKSWENKLKNNDKVIASKTAAHKMFTDGSERSEREFKQEIDGVRNNVNFYKQQIINKKEDIASIKALIPAGYDGNISGVSISDLSKLKKPLGLVSASKRYHNKNLSGGNFAVELRWSKDMGQGIEISGNHDPDGIIYSLTAGPLFNAGMTVINKSNYKEMTLEKLIPILKKVIEANKK